MKKHTAALLLCIIVFFAICITPAGADRSAITASSGGEFDLRNVSFDPPIRDITVYAERYPAELMYIIQQIDDISILIMQPDGRISAQTIQGKLPEADIILIETDMTGYETVLSNSADLSGVSYLKEYVDDMPSVLSAKCYQNDTLRCVPVALHLPDDSSVNSYQDLDSLDELPEGMTMTVAVISPKSEHFYQSVILLDALWRYASPYTKSLFFPSDDTVQ